MFDKLIVSEPEGADFKGRRNYFLVSSLVVGAVFLTAVVISIYSADIGLGTGEFELTEILPPVDRAAIDPEPPKPQPAQPSRSTSPVPQRQVNMQNLIETPTIVPITTSVVPNTQMSRPAEPFQIGPADTTPAGNGQGVAPSTGTGPVETPPVVVAPPVVPEPQPVKEPPAVKIVSGGVVNGNATSLPKPIYSVAARAVNAQGTVDVQVLIDESGRVVSAKAVSGHPLLRLAAENAARSARFTPTTLSKVPVKVTGVIVYNFVRG